MSEGAVGLAVFLAAAVAASVAAHFKLKSFIVATLLSMAVPPLLLLGLDAIRRGYVDAWAPVALLFGSLYALGISLVIGVIFVLARKSGASKGPAL